MTDELSALDPTVQWIVTEARRPVAIDASARDRLLEAIHAAPIPQRDARVVSWLVAPRRMAIAPLVTFAAAAGLVGIGVIAGLADNRGGRAPTERGLRAAASTQLPDSVAPQAIKFVLVAPQASRVSLVGDFNGWDLAATPAERQPDGSWTTFVTLRPGRHVYSFVVDGT